MMGDCSGGGTVKVEPHTDGVDWRAAMTTDMRKGAAKRLYDMLKKKVPVSNTDTLNYMARVALGCEKKLFRRAAKKENYIIGLKRKIEVIERLNYDDVRASSASSGLSQNCEPHGTEISSSLHSAFRFSNDFFGKLDGQEDTQLNVSVNQMETPRIQPAQQVAYQQCQHQGLQHQLLKHNIQQQTSCPSRVHLNINNVNFHQQSQHIGPQPSQMHYSEQMILSTQLQGQASSQQSNAIVFQRNQQLDQQNNLSLQQQSFSQKNGEYFFEQPPNPQSNFSEVQNLRNMVGPQSNILNLQSRQHSSQILQHTEVTGLRPNFQQSLQGVKLEHVLGSQKQNVSSHGSMQQRLQTPASLRQPQNVFDQQKLFQPQGAFAEASLESMAAHESAKDSDYNEQAYQKIQSLKKQYLHQLQYLHGKFKCASQKDMRVDVSEKYKKNISHIERILRFLSMSRIDIIQLPQTVVDRLCQEIRFYLSRVDKNSSSNQHHEQVMQPVGGQTPISQLQQSWDPKLLFNTANSALISNVSGLSSLSATQLENQNLHSNMFSSVAYDSQVQLKQRHAPSMLQHELEQNTSGTTAEPNISRNSGVHAFDSAAKNPAVQPQHFKRHVQPQWFQPKQQVHMQNDHLGNPLASKPSNSLDQTLPLRTSTQLHASSPPMFQHSCPPSDHKNLSPVSKASLPLQSATSPLAIPSPSSSLNLSSTSLARSKIPSGVSISEYNGHSQTSVSLAQDMIQNQVDNHSLSIGISDISASPSPTDITGPDGELQSLDTKQPIKRLIKAVESISSDTLCAAVRDITSVVNLVDMIAEKDCGSDTAGAVVDDLVYTTRCNTQVGYSSSHIECSFPTKIKRKISATALDTISSFISEIDDVNQLSDLAHDLDSTPVLKAKRQRIEPRYALLDEIKSINERLVETMIDLDSTEAGEGTIVRCSYNPVALNGCVKPHVSSQWSMLPLLLLVPASYPSSSPVIFDGFTTAGESSNGREAVEDRDCNDENLSMKAKERFSMSMRKLPAPVSLEEMARTWDKCARAVLFEYMQHFGGKCFSSIYGSWDDCVTAA